MSRALTTLLYHVCCLMNTPYKINRNDYDNIYFSSDFHYNHQKDFLWKPRGFNSFEEHDKFLENEVSKLTKNDLLIFLGDFSLNSSFDNSYKFLNSIDSRVFYVLGNHESFHSKYYKQSLNEYYHNIFDISLSGGLSSHHTSLHAANSVSDYNFQIFPFSVNKSTNKGFPGLRKKIKNVQENDIVYWGEEGYFKIGNDFLFCRHMAPRIWDKIKHSNYVAICGHSHGHLYPANVDCTTQGKILDCGVDNTLKYNGSAFFKLEEIQKIMNSKTIVIEDHHGCEHV